MKRRYRIGTSGWQYDSWRGRFSPAGLAKRGWFDFYARHMSCVELNNSFYRQPTDSTWDRWCDSAPPGFRFAVKANRYITHMKRFKDCDLPLERFLGGAERLKAYLGPILCQAPPDFDCDLGNRKHLEGFLELLPADCTTSSSFATPPGSTVRVSAFWNVITSGSASRTCRD